MLTISQDDQLAVNTIRILAVSQFDGDESFSLNAGWVKIYTF